MVSVPLLSVVTNNEYTMKDSFIFFDANYFMSSLDVDSLFTNIPLEEAINICVDNVYHVS